MLAYSTYFRPTTNHLIIVNLPLSVLPLKFCVISILLFIFLVQFVPLLRYLNATDFSCMLKNGQDPVAGLEKIRLLGRQHILLAYYYSLGGARKGFFCPLIIIILVYCGMGFPSKWLA